MAKDLPVLNLHETAIAVASCARAGRVPLVLGSPGIGKTALARAIASMVAPSVGLSVGDYPAVMCVLSNRDSVDVGGYPVVLSNDTVEQKLFGTLRQAAEGPCLLVLDEFLTCSQSVQGPALRLILERFAGEQPLHEKTRIVCLANPPDQAPGGIQLTAALVNRLVVLNCCPEVREVADYFCNKPSAALTFDLALPDDERWASRKAIAMNTVGILFETRTDLLCFQPPERSKSDGEPFGSPRAWEACCEVVAALPDQHYNTVTAITTAVIQGAVGIGAAVAYLGTLKARFHLPSVNDVLTDPKNAKLPDPTIQIPAADGSHKPIGRDVTFAAIPLVIEASRTDTYAAFLYLDRLPEEIQAACAKHMATNLFAHGSKFRDEGHVTLRRVCERFANPGATPTAETTTPTAAPSEPKKARKVKNAA